MTETSHLHSTRAFYDTVAVDYARLLSTELQNRPLDRAMLAAFAELGRPGLRFDEGPSRSATRACAWSTRTAIRYHSTCTGPGL
ncbi:hypothetical protein ABT009_39240 [Streptomyces sp. NPDC002896]|uniref:hypothetical protein n=1 Tax=Streptomyces sp. NPDC002896 TaxID=3154438 RepID=UPI003331A203